MAWWLYANDGFGNTRGGRKGSPAPSEFPSVFTRKQVLELLAVQAALGKLGTAITDIADTGTGNIVTISPATGHEVPPEEARALAIEGLSRFLHSGDETTIERPRLRLITQEGNIVA